MISKITIQNFGSIKGRQEVNFCVPGTTPDDPDRYTKLPDGLGRVNKVAAIYGANGSGKSTILHAVMFAKEFAKNSFGQAPKDPLYVPHFMERPFEGQKSAIEIEFSAQWIDDAERLYRYEIELSTDRVLGGTVSKEIVKYFIQGGWKPLLIRKGKDVALKGPLKKQIPSELVEALTRSNASFISALSWSNTPLGQKASDGLEGIQGNLALVGVKARLREEDICKYIEENEDANERLKRVIRKVDIGIESIDIQSIGNKEESDDEEILLFKHSGINSGLLYFQQSQGTLKFLSAFPLIDYALKVGGVAVMDELDSDLHPYLLEEVVGWFHDPAQNPNNAQLLMSCNSPHLMNYLEKDEIFFAEKGQDGSTETFALKNIPGVQRRDNFAKKYLAGAYGAVPNFG